MKIKTIVLVILILMSMVFTFGIIPKETSADVTGARAIAEVWGNSFGVDVTWAYTEWETIYVKLYHNSIEVAISDANYGSSGEDSDYISYSPIKEGNYRVQLWSESDDREVFSKEWRIPNLDISLSVSPTSGQIGTTFIATTTFSTGRNAPEYYNFFGNLEVSAGDITFRQNIGGTIISEDYYNYYGITDYEITPIFTSTGFTCPDEGDYKVTAKYTDSQTEITAKSFDIEMVDQYEPQISSVNQELSNTKAKLTRTGQELSTTKAQLNETIDELDLTEKSLENDIKSSNNFAYVGISVGIIGIIFGIIGIIMSRKKKYTEPRRIPPESTRPLQRAPPPEHQIEEPSGYSPQQFQSRPPPQRAPPHEYQIEEPSGYPPQQYQSRQPPQQPMKQPSYPPKGFPPQQYPPSQTKMQSQNDMKWEDERQRIPRSCPRCGAPFTGEQFCAKCGTKLF